MGEVTSPHKKQNKTKTKNKQKQNKTKTNKQTNKTNKNTFSLIFVLPETIGIFISIDIDYNRRRFIPESTQTWVGYGCVAHSFDHHPITKPEKMQICNLCLNHLFLEGPFFKPTSTYCHVNLDAKVLLFHNLYR